MITPFAPGVPLRLGRCAPKTPFHPRGKAFPAQPSAETLIYPQPQANPNCRHWKGIIVVDHAVVSPGRLLLATDSPLPLTLWSAASSGRLVAFNGVICCWQRIALLPAAGWSTAGSGMACCRQRGGLLLAAGGSLPLTGWSAAGNGRSVAPNREVRCGQRGGLRPARAAWPAGRKGPPASRRGIPPRGQLELAQVQSSLHTN